MSFLRDGAYIPGTTQNITTSGSSQQSAVVDNYITRISVTQDTYVAIGENPTATTSSMLIPAGGVEFFATTPSETKIAVLQVSEPGIASITSLGDR